MDEEIRDERGRTDNSIEDYWNLYEIFFKHWGFKVYNSNSKFDDESSCVFALGWETP